MRDPNGIIPNTLPENLGRHTLLVWESGIESIDEYVRVNQRDHDGITPRESILSWRLFCLSLSGTLYLALPVV